MKSALLTTWKTWNGSYRTTNLCFIVTRLHSARLVIRPFTTGRSATTLTDNKTLDGRPTSSSTILSDVRTSEMMAVGRHASTNYSVTTHTLLLKFFSTLCTTKFLTAVKRPLQISLSVPSTRKGVVTHTHPRRKGCVAKSLNLSYLNHCHRKKTSCNTT